jgi:hypothetical protein
MRIFYIFLLVFLLAESGFAQTCTVTGTSPLNWTNATGPSCSEGGTANGKTTLIIPAGFTLIFDSSGDTWTGTMIEVYGTLRISHDATILSSIVVRDGGRLELQAKLSLGTSPTSPTGCNFGLAIKSGGTVDVGATGSDRLGICGSDIMKGGGNGSCNSCGGTNSGECAYDGNPYCEPTGGFTGPLGYDKDGFDTALPIKLISFSGDQCQDFVCLKWATASEENFDKFIVEHSTDGVNFDSIGFIAGTDNSKTRLDYRFTHDFPILGKNYYRLRSVDWDLTFEYSSVVLVKATGKKNIVVYPNPTKGTAIQLQTNFTPSEGDVVQIFDNLGLKVLEYRITVVESVLTFNRSLKPGSYILRYTSGDFSQLIRFASN